MEPPELAATEFEQEIWAVAMCPATARGTFRTGSGSSMLDYFIVSHRTAAAIHSVTTIEGTGVKGHTPVLLTFRAKATALKALHLRRPPRLATEMVYGPIPPAPDWAEAKAAAAAAMEAARGGSAGTQALLDAAYGLWADLAEHEIADYTGELPKKFGGTWEAPQAGLAVCHSRDRPCRAATSRCSRLLVGYGCWRGSPCVQRCRYAW